MTKISTATGLDLLVDTDVLYAFLNADDPNHEAAKKVSHKIAEGTWGQPLVTDYVVDELLTLVRMRRLGTVAEQKALDLLPVDDESVFRFGLLEVGVTLLDKIVWTYRKYAEHGLSFTDASHLVIMHAHGVDRLATFDGGFEGLAELIPADFKRRKRHV